MKKIYTLLAIMLTCALTSCDWLTEDEDIAYTLEGTWQGNMYIKSTWDGRTYNSTYSEVTFLKDPYHYSNGDGYWVDYYSDAPWDYVANHITWRVDYGTIRVHFVEDGTNITIRSYRLNNNRFSGWIEDGANDVEFNLTHISSPNWNRYDHWGYDSWRNNYYYSRTTRSAGNHTANVERPVRSVGK